MKIQWKTQSFNQLTTHELYQLLKLRIDVFVVEQNCVYGDLDNADLQETTRHICGYVDNQLVGYARTFPPKTRDLNASSIGRVVTASDYRSQGIGHQLIQRAIHLCLTTYPKIPIKISAQQHLSGFYAQHGFNCIGEPYLEDGIAHIAMELAPIN